jgi:N terminus of Rad21 / Rec8 like protein
MFYSHLILTKKGPLGSVWIAATLGDRRVSKRLAATAEIDQLCRSIRAPDAPFALRLSAHLLLGVTRIFARKSAIVLADTNSLFHSLHSFSALHVLGGKKRSRDDEPPNAMEFMAHAGRQLDAISLEPANYFDKITLPAKKKRMLEQTTALRVGVKTWSSPDNEHEITSTLSQYLGQAYNPNLHALPWDGSQIPLDIDAALAMAFPTVKMEEDKSQSTGKDHSKSTFRAREQDITIQHSEELLHLGESDLLPGSIGRDELINGTVSLSPPQQDDDSSNARASGSRTSLFAHADPIEVKDGTENDALLDFATMSDRFLSPEPTAAAEPIMLSAMRREDSDNQYLNKVQPFKIRPNYSNPLQGVAEGTRAKEAPSKNLISSEDHSIHNTESFKASPTVVNTENIPATLASRARRGGIMRVDQVTELSEGFLRDCLSNTSDILFRPEIVRFHRQNRTDETLHAKVWSTMVDNLAPQLQMLWKELIVIPRFEIWTDPAIPADQNSSSRRGQTDEAQDHDISDATQEFEQTRNAPRPTNLPDIEVDLRRPSVNPTLEGDTAKIEACKGASALHARLGTEPIEPEGLRDAAIDIVSASNMIRKCSGVTDGRISH